MKRLTSIILNLLIFLMTLLAWGSMVFAVTEGGLLSMPGWRSLRFFTVLSNLFCALTAAAAAGLSRVMQRKEDVMRIRPFVEQGKEMDVLFPFGHGLSYTSFEYSGLSLSSGKIKDTESLTVRVTVRNTGSRFGKAVAQLYVRNADGDMIRPVRELKGFEKADLLQ